MSGDDRDRDVFLRFYLKKRNFKFRNSELIKSYIYFEIFFGGFLFFRIRIRRRVVFRGGYLRVFFYLI